MKVYAVQFFDEDCEDFVVHKVYKDYKQACKEAVTDYMKEQPDTWQEYIDYSEQTEQEAYEDLLEFGYIGDEPDFMITITKAELVKKE